MKMFFIQLRAAFKNKLSVVLWILEMLCAFSSCQDSVKYCVVDGDSKGIAINNGEFENSSVLYGPSTFLDNTTTELNLIDNFNILDQFEKFSTIQNADRAKIIIDLRWENLLNNHEIEPDGKKILNYVDNYYLNVKETPHSQWDLLKKQENRFYTCENQTSNCNQENSNVNISHCFQNDDSLMCKMHMYNFFHPKSGGLTAVLNQNPHQCEQIKKGCFTIFVAPCPKCEVQVALNSTHFKKTEKDTGGGEWKTIQLNLNNFTSCFHINISMIPSNTSSDNFWAIGDLAYLSKVLNCKDNKRYIEVDASKFPNATCDSVTNDNIKLVSQLPTPACDKDDDKPPETSRAFSISEEEKVVVVVVVVAIIVTAGVGVMIRKHTKYSLVKSDQTVELEGEVPLNDINRDNKIKMQLAPGVHLQ